MIIGFTGTQEGMTARQFYNLMQQLIEILPKSSQTTDYIEAHHGDCIGSDDEFHFLLEEEFSWAGIHIHPSNIDLKRAFNKADIIYEPKPPLERNPDIVNPCDILFATPKEMKEVIRSGTWATIRYARKMKKQIIIVYPDGSLGE